jgi:hypothetical protein
MASWRSSGQLRWHFTEALMAEAKKSGWWTVISMKNDWKTIFPPEKSDPRISPGQIWPLSFVRQRTDIKSSFRVR